jgi:hypothetical protein
MSAPQANKKLKNYKSKHSLLVRLRGRLGLTGACCLVSMQVPSWVGAPFPNQSGPNQKRLWLETCLKPEKDRIHDTSEEFEAARAADETLPSSVAERMVSLRAHELGWLLVGRANDAQFKLTHCKTHGRHSQTCNVKPHLCVCCVLCVVSVSVSREHALIVLHQHIGAVFIVDLQSSAFASSLVLLQTLWTLTPAFPSSFRSRHVPQWPPHSPESGLHASPQLIGNHIAHTRSCGCALQATAVTEGVRLSFGVSSRFYRLKTTGTY